MACSSPSAAIRTMPRLGVQLSGMIPDHATGLADIADMMVDLEAVGVDAVVYGEHLLYAPTMIHPTGRELGRVDRTSYVGDVMILFAAIAARTNRMRMCTSVVLAALHEPALLARQAATLDVLSHGRLDLGFGSGWSRFEFDAMGIPFEERFSRMEEVAAACQELWHCAPASFHGRYVNFDGVISEPRPTSGSVPIWWGGKATNATARRVVRQGSGWLVSEAGTEADITDGRELIRKVCANEGRDPATIRIRATLPRPPAEFTAANLNDRIAYTRATAERYAQLGVSDLTIPLAAYCPDRRDGEALIAALR
jgi:probable F420-dependent oxidoreductase